MIIGFVNNYNYLHLKSADTDLYKLRLYNTEIKTVLFVNLFETYKHYKQSMYVYHADLYSESFSILEMG